MKMKQILFFLTICIIVSITSCSKDEMFLDESIETQDTEITLREAGGIYCGLIPEFCDSLVSLFAVVPNYTFSPFQGGSGGGVKLRIGQKDVEAFHYWLPDGSPAYYIIDNTDRYVIHKSQNPTTLYFSEQELEYSKLGKLFDIDLTEVNNREGFANKLDMVSGVHTIGSGENLIYSLDGVQGGNESYRRINDCNVRRYSAVDNFIHQFTDHSGLGAVQLVGIIDQAFDDCGDGYTDKCNNCVDPRCVIDKIIANDTPAIGQYQKELMVAKYLELALGWTEEELTFFTAGQDNRDYMMNLYAVGNSIDACDHLETIKFVFEEELCDIESSDYKKCIEEQIFYHHEIEKGDFDRAIDLCDELDCFDLMAMDPNGYYEITIYVDQPVPNTNDTWSLDGGPNVGHTFIGLKSVVNGIETSILFGFYPDHNSGASPIDPLAEGEIRNDGIDGSGNPNPRNYDIAIRYTVDVSTFNAFITSVNGETCDGIAAYHLGNFNCTDFALNLFNGLGLGGGLPDTEGDWGVGSGSNPRNLGQDLRNNYQLPSGATRLIGPATPDVPVNCIE